MSNVELYKAYLDGKRVEWRMGGGEWREITPYTAFCLSTLNRLDLQLRLMGGIDGLGSERCCRRIT